MSRSRNSKKNIQFSSMDSLIETIEIMNDETLMKEIKRSRNDLKAGRVHEIRNAEELDDIWA